MLEQPLPVLTHLALWYAAACHSSKATVCAAKAGTDCSICVGMECKDIWVHWVSILIAQCHAVDPWLPALSQIEVQVMDYQDELQ